MNMNANPGLEMEADHVGPPPVQVNDVIDGQYTLVEIIGKGSSGDVWKAIRHRAEIAVVIKIMRHPGRSMKVSHAQYINEMVVRSPLPSADTFVMMTDTVMHLERECLVFDLYGMSLRDILKDEYLVSLPTFQSSAILWQVCKGIKFLHSLHVAHTDIKPENVVLANDSLTAVRHINADGKFFQKPIITNIEIKIINLEDSVIRPHNVQYEYGTAGYRAPEAYGNIGWGYGVDVFAIGCLAFELFTGNPLLPCVDDVKEYFYSIERCVGYLSVAQANDINNAHPGLFRILPRSARFQAESSLRPRRRNMLVKWVSDTILDKKNAISIPEARRFIAACTHPDPRMRLGIKSTLSHSLFSCFDKDVTTNASGN